MKLLFLRLLAFAWLVGGATALSARVDLLLIPPGDPVPEVDGLILSLHLNNPTAFPETVELPLTLKAEYATDRGHDTATLTLLDPGDALIAVPPRQRRIVRLQLTQKLNSDTGFVSLRLNHPSSNAIMFELAPAALPSSLPSDPAPPPEAASPVSPDPHLDLTSDLENMRRHISSYDPIYFVVGSRERLNARFQFSFKYRVFEPASAGDPWHVKLARDLHGAYTQTSIWDLETLSKPFYDSSYKPTIFLLHEFRPSPTSDWLFSLQTGAQHESNGRGGGPAPATPGTGLSSPATTLRHPSDSRSYNTLYLATKSRWTDDTGLFFEASARASAYFHIDENPDIARYRGYVELAVRGGYDRGFQLSALVRGHPKGHGSAEFNVTWPAIETPLLKTFLPRTLGGYAQIQYFNGYGESLLDYDVRRKDQLRFGITIVR